MYALKQKFELEKKGCSYMNFDQLLHSSFPQRVVQMEVGLNGVAGVLAPSCVQEREGRKSGGTDSASCPLLCMGEQTARGMLSRKSSDV